MPKLSPRTDRLLFLAVCCLIGIFSIGFWFPIVSGFLRSPMMRAPVTAEIPVNETIRAVWDSGLSTESTLSAIYWLDDDTVLFGANNGPKPRAPEEIRKRETWLYLWRLGEQPRAYSADPHAAARGYHCAARGEVTYHQDILDPKTGAVSRTRLVGPPGRERQAAPVKALPPGGANNPASIERTDCEIFSDPAMAGKDYVTDSERRFYLDFGKHQDLAAIHAEPDVPIVLMRADGSERVELPISNALADSGSVHFRTFEKVFYLWNSNLAASPINHFVIWRDTNCWPIWRVDPAAKTERLCIPFGPWSGIHGGATALQLASTRVGFFFAANSINAKDESGFYRLDNGIVSRIFPGEVWSSVVSPNGCRIAFTRPDGDHSLFGVFWSSVIVIDVCSPRPGVQMHSN